MSSMVHRGRSKEGKVALSIHLTPQEVAELDAMAEAQCRSRTMQAVYCIKRALKIRRQMELPPGGLGDE